MPNSLASLNFQNRNAQRAFRERKERVLKDLEDKIAGLHKVNEDQLNENESKLMLVTLFHLILCLALSRTNKPILADLKELVSRLQEENKRLQTSSTSSASGNAPQSDFTFRLPNSSVPPELNSILEQVSRPFTIIHPSDFPPANDDWLWNSSTFGTEIPQAIPPSVNFLDQYANRASTSPSTILNPYTSLSTSPYQLTSSNGSSADNTYQQDSTLAYNSLFTTGFPFNGLGALSSAPESVIGGSTSLAAVNNTNGNADSNTRPSVKESGSRHSSDSPDTTGSSTGSASSPDVQPPTPGAAASFSSASDPIINNKFAQPISREAYQATTPSNGFDMMNYRDPFLSGLTGQNSSMDFAKDDNANQLWDYNDFLVQSPPSIGSNIPIFSGENQDSRMHNTSSEGQQYISVSGSGSGSGSGSSASTLASTSSTAASSTTSSPHGLMGTDSTNLNPDDITLSDDLTYSHPLIKHVFNDIEEQIQQGTFTPIVAGCKDVYGCYDIDSLCQDMKLKATCKEVS